MADNVHSIKSFEVKSNQSFFFDNNVWMFLYCPIGNYNENKQKSISNLFEKILNRNCSIVINGLILSEFSNAYLRLDFNLWKEENQNLSASFKNDYFNTPRAQETRKIITSTVKNKILKVSEKYPDSFNSLNFDDIFKTYQVLDYNDAIIHNECKNKKWILVTDDEDFSKFNDVTILKP